MLENETLKNIKDFGLKIKKRDGVILFVGAGFSVMAGLPSFNDLIGKMNAVIEHPALKKYLEENELETFISLLRSNQKHHRDKNNLQNLLKSELGIKENNFLAISVILEYFLCLPVKCIVTTNYDELLEVGCKRLEKVYRKESRFEFKVFYDFEKNDNTIPIFKIHGDINNDDVTDLIIGYKDKNIRINDEDRNGFLDIFSFLISKYPILYIGYSLKDEFSKSLIERTVKLTDENHFFCIVKDAKGSINKELIPFVSPIIVKDYDIDLYQEVAQKIFYEYYSSRFEDSILSYDIVRLKKKLDIDFERFLNHNVFTKGLLKSLGYVLYHSKFAPEIISYFNSANAKIHDNLSIVPPHYLIELGHLRNFQSLVEFQFGMKKVESIVNDLEEMVNKNFNLLDKAEDEYRIEYCELYNTSLYHLLVVLVLSVESGSIKINNGKIESFFSQFQDPVDPLTRIKVSKYMALFYKNKKEYQLALKHIKIAQYECRYIEYKREILLIDMNKQAILTKICKIEKDFEMLRTIIFRLNEILHEFNSLGYEIGVQYTNVYLFEASHFFLLNIHEYKIATIKKSAENKLKSASISKSVRILFEKINNEF